MILADELGCFSGAGELSSSLDRLIALSFPPNIPARVREERKGEDRSALLALTVLIFLDDVRTGSLSESERVP